MRLSHVLVALGLSLALAAAASACGSNDGTGPGTGSGVGLQQLATGLSFPLYLTTPPGDVARLFIVEKTGKIRIVKDGTLLPDPFLDISTQISNGGEQGLLGLAFDPQYATNGRFVVHYTDTAGDTRLSTFQVSTNPDVADATSEHIILTVDQPFENHNGGQIVFGPDGLLYMGLGDGGSGDDPQGNGQDLTDLLGSILRLDVAAGTSYTSPPDNPFVGRTDARPEIWNYGLRNPWRFSFDRSTGDLYIGDVGQGQFEEIDVATAAAGSGKGLNFGWNIMEGAHCLNGSQCDPTGLVLPAFEYTHSEGCSVTGGYVYRGQAIPSIQGQYFYSDFCQGWVHSFRYAGGTANVITDWPALKPGGNVSSFGEDASGELYVLDSGGTVFKIVPAP
jgi:glucose/arabinose dehydrogenase